MRKLSQPNSLLKQLDVSKVGEVMFGDMVVEVIDAPREYAAYMKELFDFDALRKFIARADFSIVADAMHGGMWLVYY